MKLFLLWWLRLWARLELLKNRQAQIIGVTGSGGKSSTREAIYAAIRNQRVVKHCAFGNSETGIPLDILGIVPVNYSSYDWIRMGLLAPWKVVIVWERYDVLLLELGIDSPDWPRNMDFLLSIVKPTIGVFTCVSSVHGQMFDSLIPVSLDGVTRESAIKSAIAQEKGKLLQALPTNGTAVVYGDEPLINTIASGLHAKVFSFGEKATNDIRILDIVQSLEIFEVRFQIAAEVKKITIPHQILGETYGRTFAAALGVVSALGLDLEKAIRGIEKDFRLPPSRMNALRGIRGSTIIDSSYNSSHTSMLDAIALVQGLPSVHKIAVLGDMREIGESSEYVHVDVLQKARAVFDEIVLVGEQFGKVVDTDSGQARMTKQVTHFNKADKNCIENVRKLIKECSLILVKGSQNTIFLEVVIEALLENHDDVSRLCRQSDHWKKTKRDFFGDSL